MTTVAIVGCWRACSELMIRSRELRRSGQLRVRLEDRSAQRRIHAFARARLDPAWARSGVQAGASSVHRERDLLKRAMARTVAIEDAAGAATGPVSHGADVRPVAWFAVVGAVAGVVLSSIALVRPLADGAPWFALAGGALIIAAMLGASRARR